MRTGPDVLEEQDVIGKVRHAMLGDADKLEKVWHLEGHKEAYPLSDQPLRQRVHPFPKPDRVADGEVKIRQAVDYHALRACLFD